MTLMLRRCIWKVVGIVYNTKRRSTLNLWLRWNHHFVNVSFRKKSFADNRWDGVIGYIQRLNTKNFTSFFHLFCFCLIFFIKHWLQIIIYTPAAWGDVAAKGGRTSAGGGRAVVLGRTKTVRGGVWVFGLVQTISPRPTRTSAHDASWDASTSIHARNAPYDGMFVC